MDNKHTLKSQKDSLATIGLKMGGINGTNFIPSNTAKLRLKIGMIEYAKLNEASDGYTVTFHSYDSSSLYNYEPYELCEPLQGLKAMTFHNKENARNYLKQFGFTDNIILD